VKLRKVEFANFKSIEKATLEIGKRITALVGENETGKTNVLEAIRKFRERISFDSIRDKKQHSLEHPTVTVYFELESGEEELYEVLGARKTAKTLEIRREGEHYEVTKPTVSLEHSSLRDEVLKQQIAELEKKEEESEEEPTQEEQQEKGDLEQPEENITAEPEVDELALREAIMDWLFNYLPLIEYFPGYEPKDSDEDLEFFIPNEVEIKKLRDEPSKFPSLVKLMSLGGITPQVPFEDSAYYHIRADASTKISKRIASVWPQEKDLEIELNVSPRRQGFLGIKIKDGKMSGDCWMDPNQRSYGFQWFLAFYARFLAEMESKVEGKILLFDEPGIFLHAKGQKELLGLFEKIANNGNQIIYTTHSPFMLDTLTPERLRLLKKGTTGTKINNRPWAKSKFGVLPHPIRAAVGALWVDSFFCGDVVLLIEGVSDKIILVAFSKLLESLKKKIIDFNRVTLLPAYGASLYPALISILSLEELPIVALLDSDDEGERVKEKLLANKKLQEDDIIMIKSVAPRSQRETIEDLIPKPIWAEAVNEVYQPTTKFKNPTYPFVKTTKNWLVSEKVIEEDEDLDKISLANGCKKYFIADEVFNFERSKVKGDFEKLYDLIELLRQKLKDKLPIKKKQ
jgi:predicted ATPase